MFQRAPQKFRSPRANGLLQKMWEPGIGSLLCEFIVSIPQPDLIQLRKPLRHRRSAIQQTSEKQSGKTQTTKQMGLWGTGM